MAEAYNANNDIFASFGSNMWTVNNGILTFNGANNLVSYDSIIYVDGAKASSDVKNVAVNEQIALTGAILDGATPVALTSDQITVTTGSEYVSVVGNVVTITGNSNENIVITAKFGNATATITLKVTGMAIAEEYFFSASEGKFFNQAGDEKTLAEVLGSEVTLTSAVDKDGVNVLSNGAIANVASSKDGLIDNKFMLTTDSGFEYTVFVKVATLVIDEAADLDYFTYHGAFTTTDAISDATQKAFATWLTDANNGEQNEFMWNGYYLMVKDVDGAAEGYVHNKMGNSGMTQMVFASTPDVAYFITNYYNLASWSPQHCAWYQYNGRGFKGTFDGNGHTISNLTTDRQGLFGLLLEGSVVKNVGLIEVGANDGSSALAEYAIGATVSNVYFNNTNTYGGFIKSSNAAGASAYGGYVVNNATSINNVVLVYNNAIPTHGAVQQDKYMHLLGPQNASEGQAPTAAGVYCDINNLVVISWASPAVKMGDSWTGAKIWTDCAYLDGVATPSTTTAQFNNDGTERTPASAYTVYTLGENTQRFTTPEKAVDAYNANNSIYSAFTAPCWSVVDGMLTFGA
jgi:hypothetical protein